MYKYTEVFDIYAFFPSRFACMAQTLFHLKLCTKKLSTVFCTVSMSPREINV